MQRETHRDIALRLNGSHPDRALVHALLAIEDRLDAIAHGANGDPARATLCRFCGDQGYADITRMNGETTREPCDCGAGGGTDA